jgi:hypothetical protein
MIRRTDTAQTINHDPLRRERRRMDSGIRLMRSLEKNDTTIKGLAACLGVSESRVKAIQVGRQSIPLDDVPLMPAAVGRDLLTDTAEQCGLGVHEPIDSSEDYVNSARKILSMEESIVERLMEIKLEGGITPEQARDLQPRMRELSAHATALFRLCERALKEGRRVDLDEEKR